jgi:hypothetical protein
MSVRLSCYFSLMKAVYWVSNSEKFLSFLTCEKPLIGTLQGLFWLSPDSYMDLYKDFFSSALIPIWDSPKSLSSVLIVLRPLQGLL